VAEHLIQHLTRPGAVVLDPMVGSGTTLVAANKYGCQGIGVERDPLALLIAKSATRSFDSNCLEQVRERILVRADSAATRSQAIQLCQVQTGFPREELEFIRYWFPARSQKQLLALAASIRNEPNGPARDLAWVVFSSLIIAKSQGASYALDISRSRPHRRLDKPIALPFTDWNRRFKTVVKRLPFRDIKPPAASGILAGDARSLPLEDAAVDFILTSPPYLNAIDYLRMHKFPLIWMGYSLKSLRQLRGTMIGTERGLWSVNGLPRDLEERLDNGLATNRRRALVRRYLCDLRKVLAEISRVLRPNGLALLVLGPALIEPNGNDAVEIVSRIGTGVGLQELGHVERTLNKARRSLPPPSSAKRNQLAKRMDREFILALRK
jgi:DNA modification methylase